jgi:hypothetical protein
MAREVTGKHKLATGQYPSLRPVTAEEMGVELVRSDGGPPGWLSWALEKFGLPTLFLGVAVYLGVQLFLHMTSEAAKVRVHHAEQMDKLIKHQKERDEVMVKAIDKLSTVLDDLPDRLKEGGRRRVRDERLAEKRR